MPTHHTVHPCLTRAAVAIALIACTVRPAPASPAADSVRVGPAAPAAVVPVGPPAPAGGARAAEPDSTRDFIGQWLGLSGNLRAIITTPAQAFGLPVMRAIAQFLPRDASGVFDLGLSAPDGEPVRLLALLPFGRQHAGRLGPYRLGRWPQERGRRSYYDAPQGFIEVTPENLDTPVSKRFTLADFVTHDQSRVWPKYLVLRPPLLDKLELIGEELDRLGRPSAIRILSGFRSPQYNARGIARGAARARDSRHMYGDAADIVVDDDGDGRMDDLNSDGRVDTRDARWLRSVVDSVEHRHPELVGGVGLYRSSRTHGPFLHVDARGWRARW